MKNNFKENIFGVAYEIIRRVPFLNHLAHRIVQSDWIFKVPFYKKKYAGLIGIKSKKIFYQPPVLELTITNRCNSRCIMCPTKVHSGQDMMNDELFKKIIIEAEELGIKKMNLTGGETLLVPDIAEKIKFAKNHSIEYIHMFSNGSLLDDKKIKEILNSGLDSLTISIDSPIKEKYENIRIGLNFDTVFANIKNLFNYRKMFSFKKPLIRINLVTLKENIGDRKLFKKTFKPFADIVEIIDSHNFAGSIGSCGGEEYTQVLRFPCYLMFSKIVIDADGKVRKCSIDYSEDSYVGDLKKETLTEILHSPKVVELKNQMSNYDFSAPGCKNCTFKESWWVNY